MAVLTIAFKAGGRIYSVTSGVYDVSNLSEVDLMRLKESVVESYKILHGVSAKTEWIA